jgi:hypothetical protein
MRPKEYAQMLGRESEDAVALHYLRGGYAVQMAGVNAPGYDMRVALMDGDIYQKVQVKRVRRRIGRKALLTNLNKKDRPDYTLEDFDLLVLVDATRRMWAIPHEDVLGRATIALTDDYEKYRIA